MKKTIHLVLGLLVFCSCQEENTDRLRQASFNAPFKGEMHETVYVKDTASAITLEVNSISDERCPIHQETCTDKGTCAVRVKLSNMNNSTAETILSIDNSAEHQMDAVSVNLAGKVYSIQLQGVNPKPANPVTGTPKAAEFLISEYVEDEKEVK